MEPRVFVLDTGCPATWKVLASLGYITEHRMKMMAGYSKEFNLSFQGWGGRARRKDLTSRLICSEAPHRALTVRLLLFFRGLLCWLLAHRTTSNFALHATYLVALLTRKHVLTSKNV